MAVMSHRVPLQQLKRLDSFSQNSFPEKHKACLELQDQSSSGGKFEIKLFIVVTCRSVCVCLCVCACEVCVLASPVDEGAEPLEAGSLLCYVCE